VHFLALVVLLETALGADARTTQFAISGSLQEPGSSRRLPLRDAVIPGKKSGNQPAAGRMNYVRPAFRRAKHANP